VCEEYFHLTSTVQDFLRLGVVQSSADLEVPFSKYSSRVVGRGRTICIPLHAYASLSARAKRNYCFRRPVAHGCVQGWRKTALPRKLTIRLLHLGYKCRSTTNVILGFASRVAIPFRTTCSGRPAIKSILLEFFSYPFVLVKLVGSSSLSCRN
jgi:hypothetical protein